ncbi:hypothetical protein ES332_D08G105300v1 [Gossypium tomentosum]|uniref:Reverse transcriptase zinc-binding domain-containing protein n=1 Tax=Gossypium tomentosum TaxID=34277 RepID=A0A5D2JS71_GOSTO|nr:hypothetical protein ES332_D08G105300v1 [Gossypium tomentosum]
MRRKGLEIYEFFFGASFVQDRSDSWRLMTQTNSLVAKVLKANYYPRSNFLNVVLRQGASYTWQSIWSAKMVLSEGIDWRVGTGENISIVNHAWIPDSINYNLSNEIRTKTYLFVVDLGCVLHCLTDGLFLEKVIFFEKQ